MVQVRVADDIPPNFKYLKGSARLDGITIPDPSGHKILIFDIGNVPALVDSNGNGVADPGEQGYMKLSYKLIVGSGATPGDYVNTAAAIDVCDVCYISNPVEAQVTVTLDPLFDLGTIIGKVFDDKNRDGWQDEGEQGIAGIMVALDDGTYALTDEYGRYHFPAVKPGHRLVKVNLSSLAGSAIATTDEALVVSVTPGLLAKANFGVLYAPETLKIGNPSLTGVWMKSKAVHQPIQLTGNAETLAVLINGEMASIPTSNIHLQVKSLDEVVEIKGNQLSQPVVFRTETKFATKGKSWRLNIMDAKGLVIRTLRGKGALPKTIRWDGRSNTKRTVKGGEIYQYQLEVKYTDGSRSASARKLFGINQTTAISINLAGGAYLTGSSQLSPEARKALKETAELLRKFPNEKIIIEGHTDAVGTAESNLKLSKSRAEAALAYLVNEEKIPAKRFEVRWFGESRPVTSNESPEGRVLNRRIEIKGQVDKIERSKLFDQYRTEPSLKINGVPKKLDSHGRFSMQIAKKTSKKFSIEMINSQGQSFQTTFSVPGIEILKPADNLYLPFGTTGTGYRIAEPTDTKQSGAQAVLVWYDLLGRTDPSNSVEIDGKPVTVKPDGTFQSNLKLKRGNNPYGILVRNPDGTTRIVNLIVTVNDRDKDGQFIITAEPVPNLMVNLPPQGIRLTNQLLTVSGATDPGNHVHVNGEPVNVESNGNFSTVVNLPKGKSQLEIMATDPEGRTGVIPRQVEIKDTHLFFLAFADGKFGQLQGKGYLEGAGMEESEEYYTEGRLAFYLKGVIKGKYLITAALDTGTNEFDELFKDLDETENDRLLTNLDPDKLYPVYGDSSTIVNDTQSQGKLYLALDSDEFHLLVGNYALSLTDTELAAYQRNLYGARMAYQSVSKTKYGQPDTKITLFGAEVRQVHIRDELQATGGSLYYLSHREVIEGSEQVTLVVMDTDTGLVISRRPQQQNVDYTIKYDGGRILFNRPISSFAEDDTLIDQSLVPDSQVYIQVDYEARVDSFEKTAGGGHVRQQIGDHLAVGGTYVKDELNSGEYELQAVDAEIRFGKNTRIIGEYAESSGTDSQTFESNDGGVTYTEATPTVLQEGRAWKAAIELDIGEWFGTPDLFQIGAYFKQIEPGFHSNGTLTEAGTEKSGLNMKLQLTENNKFLARYDLIKTDATAASNETETDIGTMQWVHDRQWWGLTAEYQTRTLDTTESTSLAAARLRINPTDNLTVNAEHQETLTGTENDQTTLGLKYQVLPSLALETSGTTGTYGESVQGGATLTLGDKRVYLTERLAEDQAGRTTSTVFGTEAAIDSSSKIYSEYQWEHSDNGDRNISLLGAQKQWEAVKGLKFNLSGEYSAIEDPQETSRYTIAGGISYANPSGFKATTREEVRRESGAEERVQYLTTNHVELKLNPDFTLLGKYRYSETRDLDLEEKEAFFNELSVGLAYRPVAYDRFNALARYTMLSEQGPLEVDETESSESKTDVASIEWSFDINRYIEWVEKGAFRIKTEETGSQPPQTTHTYLSINRLNFNIWSKIDLGMEYRILLQKETDDSRKGWLAELMWEPKEHFRIGVGYNFTDFSDNEFSDNDYSVQGWFTRFQVKF